MSITTSTRKVYHRPSCGECSCKQEYEGQDDLLFNLYNKHLFYYDFLFSYLHSMVEGKNLLVAFLTACERNHGIQSHTLPVRIKVLRQAWNTFARLLDIDPQQTYQCPVCGLEPQTVIGDGTMIGFRTSFQNSSNIQNKASPQSLVVNTVIASLLPLLKLVLCF